MFKNNVFEKNYLKVVLSGAMATAMIALPSTTTPVFAQAAKPQAAAATPLPAKKTVDGFEMVLVKGGSYKMGCTGGDYCQDEAKPAHTVTVSDFYIGKYEVTLEQWYGIEDFAPRGQQELVGGASYEQVQEFMKHLNARNNTNYAMPTKAEWDKAMAENRLPVEVIEWNRVQAFISKLNQKTGKKYRLPTEAEWEYAARGGNQSKGYMYSGSNNINEVAWCADNTDGLTQFVGRKKPNELGIYDMSGNVWEWCSDWYDENYYSNSPAQNPKGPKNGSDHVIRGWGCDHEANKFGYTLNRMYGSYAVDFKSHIGFRLVLPL